MANKITLTQLKIDFGMLYAIKLTDGRLILVDGGHSQTHRQEIIDFVEKNKIGDRAVIASWIFTHLDGDHINAAFEVLLNRQDLFDVQNICISFPNIDDFAFAEGEHPQNRRWKEIAIEVQEKAVEKFEKIKAAYPNAEIWAPKWGEHRKFGEVDVHVLITGEERLPLEVYSHNQRSLVVRFTFPSGKTCMLTGDSGGSARAEFLLNNYPPEVLKSDILQVIHHGLYGGHLELYQAVDPDICFWPTTEARFFGYEMDRDGNPVSYHRLTQDLPFNAWLRDNSIRIRTHFHGEQSVEIDTSDLSTTVLEEPK